MAKYTQITKQEDFDQVWENSANHPVIVFKHSITCPISANAFEEFKSYMEDAEEEAHYLIVSEVRDVSNQIAETTNIQHQSPQILLIKDKNVVWDASHTKITQGNIKEATANV